MKIGIIGAGNVGKALGKGWAAAGHEVVYGVRSPGGAPPHEGARLAGIREAVEASEVVVLATPWGAVGDALAAAGDFGGRVLIDATNPIGPGFALTVGHTSSGGEEVEKLAKNARVVKSFNTTGFENMENPRYGDRRAVMFVAADDKAARDAVVSLANDLGFEGVGLSTLKRARDLEPFGMLWIHQSRAPGAERGFAFGLLRRSRPEEAPSRRAERARRILIVGTGNIGGALAKGWLGAGHDVRLAVRDASARDVEELVSRGAKVVPLDGAASDAEVVVIAVPFSAVDALLPRLGDLRGKTVVDCTNALGPGLVLQHGHTTSAAEQLAAKIPGAHVVKSFNQQGAEVLRAPRFDGVRATNFVAGDDEDAKRTVMSLTEDIGLEAVDAGPLSRARYLEHVTTVWISASQPLGTREFGLAVLRR